MKRIIFLVALLVSILQHVQSQNPPDGYQPTYVQNCYGKSIPTWYFSGIDVTQAEKEADKDMFITDLQFYFSAGFGGGYYYETYATVSAALLGSGNNMSKRFYDFGVFQFNLPNNPGVTFPSTPGRLTLSVYVEVH